MLSVARAATAAARSWVAVRGARAIATSGKKNDTAVVAPSAKSEPIMNEKNWVSFGFDHHDRVVDENARNSVSFFVITVVFVCGGYYLMYRPDSFLSDWSSREAFLVLRERENAGLPLISPDYVDPANIDLPSDEELGDAEIII